MSYLTKAGDGVVAYESEKATVVCGDARLVLPQLDTGSIDCVITDPPYGVAWQSDFRKERFSAITGDETQAEAGGLLASVTPELVRVTRHRRHLYTFGLALSHPLLVAKASLIWDKEQMGLGDLSSVWSLSHEPIFFHVRNPNKADAAAGRGALAARLRRGSIIRVPRYNSGQVRRHPTEKPVELMRQLVESSSTQGEMVLDPFAGVGSLGVAAILAGRRTILIEIDEGYASIAAERVRAAEDIARRFASL